MALYKRKYKSYRDYLNHQQQKLTENLAHYQEVSQDTFDVFVEKLRDVCPRIPGHQVLCLGARLGEEVRAFRKLGYSEAVGIDLNPGPNNQYVIEGDFHDIPFEDITFDGVYCNCLDHAWDLRKVSTEAARVLKPDGVLVLDVSFVKPYKKHKIRRYRRFVKKAHKYESMLWGSLDDVLSHFNEFYEVDDRIISTTHKIIVFMRKHRSIKSFSACIPTGSVASDIIEESLPKVPRIGPFQSNPSDTQPSSGS